MCCFYARERKASLADASVAVWNGLIMPPRPDELRAERGRKIRPDRRFPTSLCMRLIKDGIRKYDAHLQTNGTDSVLSPALALFLHILL